MTDTIESLRKEISDLRKQDKLISDMIRRKMNKLDKLELEENKKYFGDIAWLINHPNEVGQHDAMCKWIVDKYGGEYCGVQPSGYRTDTRQQCFDLILIDEYHGSKPSRTETFVENAKSFLVDHIDLFKPEEDGFVRFKYESDEQAGLFFIAYRPVDKTWWLTNTRYGRCRDKKQESFENAIQKAQDKVRYFSRSDSDTDEF